MPISLPYCSGEQRAWIAGQACDICSRCRCEAGRSELRENSEMCEGCYAEVNRRPEEK